MKHEPAASIGVNPDDLAKLIESCQYASRRLEQTIAPLSSLGRSRQEWAHDAVSLDVARYYDEQIYEGDYSNYATLRNYQRELDSTVVTLKEILANYQSVDGAAADTMEKL